MILAALKFISIAREVICMIKKHVVLITFFLCTIVLHGLWCAVGVAEVTGKSTIKNYDVNDENGLNLAAIESIHHQIGKKTSFSFIVLGDSNGNFRQFNDVLRHACARNPDFIIHTGDLTVNGSEKEYREAIELCSRWDVPLVLCPGNHDLRGDGADNFEHFFGPMNFAFDINDRYRVVCINNNNMKQSGPPTNKGRLWRYENGRGIEDNTMEMIKEELHVDKEHFIIMHIPPPVAQFRFKAFTWNGAAFLRLVEQQESSISRIFCGHIHGYGEARHGQVPCVVTGGAGGNLQIARDGIDSRFHYVLVTAHGDRVSHEACFIE